MIWEVFRQEKPGGYHTHCGNVHAPDAEMATMFAEVQHGRRKPTNSLWVVPQESVATVNAEETTFGGTTDKSYRWAMTYNRVDESFAAEVADSQREQESADREHDRRSGDREHVEKSADNERDEKSVDNERDQKSADSGRDRKRTDRERDEKSTDRESADQKRAQEGIDQMSERDDTAPRGGD